MNITQVLRSQLRLQSSFAVRILSTIVMAHGLFILATTLLDQIDIHHGTRLRNIAIDVPLLIGLGLLYVGSVLRRRKRTAWFVAILAYTFYLGLGVANLSMHREPMMEFVVVIRLVILPISVLSLLILFKDQFVVKSDIPGFRGAARLSIIMILAALLYGVIGFELLDVHDFHQEIGIATAAHYTIDQFDLTTVKPLHPYTRRAHLFASSLSFVSVATAGYVALSLFQPFRQRLSDQAADRARLTALLEEYGAPSEDFFKLWPHDKHYYFEEGGRSALAFHVSRGVALCLGDPVGKATSFESLLKGFRDLCYGNDWLPAFIHVDNSHEGLYAKHGFSLQKIGQEAVLGIAEFQTDLAPSKYFRQIANKFGKQGYSCELLLPPHHSAVINRLQVVSDEWLERGGRTERGFVMGYFTPEYMQLCNVLIARDAAGTIQAFINQVPATFDHTEATFDMLRHAKNSLGNTNDYVMMNFVSKLQAEGYQRLNLGLCPLIGLDENDGETRGLIDNVLSFVYANGDRFYAFSGLHRFKAKYKPQWHDRYIAYQGGVRGFSRTTTALVWAMRVKR